MRRMPAEWEPHRATWLSWPHQESDWPGRFAAVPWVFVEMVRLLSASEVVEILCHDQSVLESARAALEINGVTGKYNLHLQNSDRGWLRDAAPTYVMNQQTGKAEWIKWEFNGWAKYDNHKLDQQIPDFIGKLTGIPVVSAVRSDNGKPLVLEGGAIEVNGAGVLICTEECLLSPVQERNPGLTREAYNRAFKEYLGVEQVIWLAGSCEGDDTHGHIDDVVRFVGPRCVVAATENNPDRANYAVTQNNLKTLKDFRFSDGGKLEILELPFPEPVLFEDYCLPASYANFYIGNKVVLVPIFNDPQDYPALTTLRKCFPDREVVGVFARDLVLGLGTFHCLTQQEPLAL